ncbi:glycosyltransferase family A protein [Litorisediminicola beolgyonensis]|uniref:Glycosyltransferase family A protein n=1 Tax=Litorisediminicola beolgyonensis TaxID=1173614 RepID=A0ABW3ZH73_9RHOB
MDLAAEGRAWRAAHPPRPPSDTPEVVFVIPLISKARAHDWARVCRTLADTLASLRAQTSPAWRALVCCQDRPEGIAFDDTVSFLPFERPDEVSPETVTKFDNHAKKTQMILHLAKTHGGDGYLFQLDADDMLHPELVAHMVGDNNGAGYLIPKGYMMHAETRALAYLGPKRLRYPFANRFDRECGSSSAIRFDFRDGDACLEPIRKRGKHKEIADHMAAYGFEMTEVPFPAALYVIGHGENMRQRRGKMGAKERYLRRNRLSKGDDRAARAAFGLAEEIR